MSPAYDLADRVTQITYPSGRIVQYGRDAKGRVSSVSTKASVSVSGFTTLASGLTYEPFGAVKTMALGSTLSVANDWGNDGRLASRRLYSTSAGTNLSLLAYEYDGNDNLISVADQINVSDVPAPPCGCERRLRVHADGRRCTAWSYAGVEAPD